VKALAVLTVGAALAASLWRGAGAQAPPGAGGGESAAPPVIAPVTLPAFAGDDAHWVWLRQDEKGSELYVGGPQTAPKKRAAGKDWVDLSLDGNRAWILQAGDGSGALLEVSLAGASAPVARLEGLHAPTGVLARGGAVYWLETLGPVGQDLGFIPLAGRRARLRAREASGKLRTLAELPVGERAVLAPPAGDLLGATDADLYLRLSRLASTEFWRVPLGGGEPERIGLETDFQEATLGPDGLYWTAPSEEATPQFSTVCIRRARSGKAPETLTDWLPHGGSLARASDAVYYLQADLYRLPARSGIWKFVRHSAVGRLGSDGSRLALLPSFGDDLRPMLLPARGE